MRYLGKQTTLVLASSSPRRRALLDQAGIDYTAVAPLAEEPHVTDDSLTPCEHAEALAYYKARSVADARPDDVILAADTICELNGEILGKADSAGAARAMLGRLSGTHHRVITGVAICLPGGQRLIANAVTGIKMRPIKPTEIDAYVNSGEWEGKAGAYAIQETADRYVEAVDGSFTNVVGLPVELVRQLLSACE